MKVFPCEADFRFKLKIASITDYILICAGKHSEECGLGIAEMEKIDCSWVLSRVVIEMYDYPKMSEEIQIQTWVEGVVKFFAKRNYEFLSKDGKVLGYARTIWANIDNKTRKARDLTNVLTADLICDKECPIKPISKIPEIKDEVTPLFTFGVKYSDVDFNQHLNSCKYVEHMLDAFTLHKFEHRDVKRFEIDFLKEAYFNENLSLYKKEIKDNNSFFLELQNEKGEKISKSRVVFGEKKQIYDYNPGIHYKE